MAYLSHEQVAAQVSVLGVGAFEIPANATHVELQASTQNVVYTMDGFSDPTATEGMVLLTTEPPKLFLIQDLRNMRFVRGAAGAMLELHYLAGRDV